ncbi:ParB N-terminal domain-containing protein [Candidatus Woesearchaeota archaeon]|nr:ParB N-terminal domain-containing protein [Candidatus Woesearchaeota archaeon]
MKYTLKEALEYSKNDNSREWVASILRSTDNESMAKRVEDRGILIGPVEVSLDKMIRHCGPEPGMKFPEEKEVFEKRIGNMVKDIEKGWDVPPLVVWFLDHEYSLADGSHRFEALKRSGKKKYWTFIWFENKEDHDYYLSK